MTQNTTKSPNRRIPTWAVGLHNRLAQDRPAVVTRADIGMYLAEVDSNRDVDDTVKHLQRLGWLVPVHLKGVWAYLPPGEEEITDRYIDLRAWMARDPDAVFALAGEAAAWHLGYLDREFSWLPPIWLPTETRMPFGLRQYVSEVKLGWGAQEIKQLLPSSQLLHQRHLDLTKWAGGIPAFGPEALVVQLSTRVKSFHSWADLIPHIEQLASDVDTERLSILLSGKSQSAWQRAGYLLDRGGRHDDGLRLLNTRPRARHGGGRVRRWTGCGVDAGVPDRRSFDRSATA